MPDQTLPAAIVTRHPKLTELRPEFRPLVEAILEELVVQGYLPKIVWAYRTQEQQTEIHRKGYGPAKVGAHGWGCAVDLVDRRWAWPQANDPSEVWEKAAQFFLALRAICDSLKVANFGWIRMDKSAWKKWGLGSDPAHCQLEPIPQVLRQDFGPGKRG